MQVSAAVSYERLEPHIQNAENAFLIPLLGKDMYDALVDYNNNEQEPKYINPSREWPEGVESPTSVQKAYAITIWHAQHAILHLAYNIGFDVISAYISDAGFKRQESDTQKSLFKYQEDNLKKYFLENGMNSLDDMLEAIEKNIDHFPEFDDKLGSIKGQIIPDTQTFNKHYNIKNSRLIFMRLQQHIKTVQELELTRVVNKNNMELIHEELKKEQPDEKVEKALPYIRDPLAYLSVVMLMEETGAEITEKGLYFAGQRSFEESDYVIMPTDESRVKYLVRRNNDIAQAYITRLRKHLKDNGWEGDFGVITNSLKRDNDGKRIFVA